MLNPRTAPEVGTMVPFRAALLGRPFSGDRRVLCVVRQEPLAACLLRTRMWPVRARSWFRFGTRGLRPPLCQRRGRTAHSRRPWHSEGSALGAECQLRDWPGVCPPHPDFEMAWESADGRAHVAGLSRARSRLGGGRRGVAERRSARHRVRSAGDGSRFWQCCICCEAGASQKVRKLTSGGEKLNSKAK